MYIDIVCFNYMYSFYHIKHQIDAHDLIYMVHIFAVFMKVAFCRLDKSYIDSYEQ